MEDKRTLLAFVAIGVILLLMPYYQEFLGLEPKVAPEEVLAKPAGEPGAEASGAAAGQIGRVGEPASAGGDGSGVGAWVAGGEVTDTVATARRVVVSTPLQRFEFDTRGAVLRSVRLRKYHRVGGEEVELVPDGRGEFGLLVRRLSGEEEMTGVVFSVDRDSVEIGVGEEAEIRLRGEVPGGGVVEKRLRFSGSRYGFGQEIAYQELAAETELGVRWQGGLAFTEKDPGPDLSESRALVRLNDEVTKVQVNEGGDEETFGPYKGAVGWAAVSSKYFLSALVPMEEGTHRVTLSGRGGSKSAPGDFRYEVGFRAEGEGRWASRVYLGPLEYQQLLGEGRDLEQAIDFGWPVVRQVSRLLLVAFKAAYAYVPNYGWIIVLFAVAIKLLVSPLTHKTNESTAKMQQLQPKIAALRERYKNDSQRLSKETMKLYKEEGVNPLGGCLPMVLQMPVFFALYNLFGRTIELRQSPWLGWVTDLSVPDQLVVAGLPIHVLAVLMGGSMWLQQKMTMKDPKQAMLVYLMPAVMTVIFWSMSSGLVLYWTVFNVLTIAQQVGVNLYRGKPAFA
jgi:YidC/Oxa1 family membrane protein insertase